MSRLKKERSSPRPRPAVQKSRPFPLRLVGVMGAAVLWVVFSLILWQGGYISRIIDDLRGRVNGMLMESGLTLGDVAVEGRSLTPSADILRAVGLPKGGFIFGVAVQTIQENLEKLPTVRAAIVERRLPGTLAIRLLERTPIALWQKNGHLQLIDERGDSMGPMHEGMPSHLMIITGEGAPKNAPALFQALRDFPLIRSKVTGAVFMGNRRWDLLLDSKIRLKLSETDIRGSLESFWDLEQNHHATKKDISAIDLRFKDKIYFYLTPDGVKGRRQSPPKKT